MSGDLGDVDVLYSNLDLCGDSSLGVGKDGSLDERVVGLEVGLGVDEAGPHTAPLGDHTDVGVTWPPVLILLHTAPVRLECRFVSLDLVGNLGGDLGDVDMLGSNLNLGGDDGLGQGVVRLGLGLDDVQMQVSP